MEEFPQRLSDEDIKMQLSLYKKDIPMDGGLDSLHSEESNEVIFSPLQDMISDRIPWPLSLLMFRLIWKYELLDTTYSNSS